MKAKLIFLLILVSTINVFSSAEESLNEYYAYPVSVGVSYCPLSPVAGVEKETTVNDLFAKIRVPLPFMPELYPFAVGGFSNYDSTATDIPDIIGGVLTDGAVMPEYDERDTWDHRNYFGGIGFGYAYRMNKEFETGIEVFGAISQSYYPQRVIDAAGAWYPVGEFGILAGADGKISLNPSFNISIDVMPSLRFSQTFEQKIPGFDGLFFGLGLAAHYRFGEDPDAPQSEIRAIKFNTGDMPPVFAAMQKVYIKKPITEFELTNIGTSKITGLELYFNQAGYMDSPTLCTEINLLEPQETVKVPLHASFNDAVFTTVDTVPLNGEIIATYTYRNRTATQTRSLTFNLQDRNSLTWDDDRKIAAFITPKDSAVRNYASFVADRAEDSNVEGLPDSLEIAIQIYHALEALDLGYQSDPVSPFEEAQGSPMIIDTVSLARETLRRGTGDCDDITVLYNTLLESVSVPTGIVTVPGHIYAAVNTGLAPREYMKIHPDRNMTLVAEDSLWVLVEITMIGKSDFLEAWKTGMDEWNAYSDNKAVRNFYSTRSCQESYKPVGLQETDIGLQYGDPETFITDTNRVRERLAGIITEPVFEDARSKNNPRTWNKAGISAAQLGSFTEAADAFSRAIKLDSEYLSPYINQGSVLFLKKDYRGAESAFNKAKEKMTTAKSEKTALTVYINLAKTMHALGRPDDAGEYIELAKNINAEEAALYSYTAEINTDGTRASNISGPAILFDEVE